MRAFLSMRDLTATEADVLCLVGAHLGRQQRCDLAGRVRLGAVKKKDTRRADRERRRTLVSSSRWAGAMTRASEDQYRLSLRCLKQERTSRIQAIDTITCRLAVACGERKNGVRGCATQAERFQKQRRLQYLTARLAVVEQQIAEGRPSIVVGGRNLAKNRQHLADTDLTVSEWRERWQSERLFLTADGESGAPFGNHTITVDPHDGPVTLVLPEPLRHLANVPRGRYKLGCTVTFNHRRGEWLAAGPGPRTREAPRDDTGTAPGGKEGLAAANATNE